MDLRRRILGLSAGLAGGVVLVAAVGLVWPPEVFAAGATALTVGAFVAVW